MDPNAGHWAHCLRYAAKSDVGLRRANNQDSLNVALASGQQAWADRGHLFMVADGMGAHAAGELASKIAADVVSADLSQAGRPVAARGPGQRRLRTPTRRSTPRPGQPRVPGMGTTCSALVCLPAGALGGPRGRQPRLSPAPQPDRTADVRSQPGVGNAARPDGRRHGEEPASRRTSSRARSGRTPVVKSTWKARFRSSWATRSCCAATGCRAR